jgi:hypothetical protein
MSKMRPKMQRNACTALWCRHDRLPAYGMLFCRTHAQLSLDMGWTNPRRFDLVRLGLTHPDRLDEVYYPGVPPDPPQSRIARWWLWARRGL